MGELVTIQLPMGFYKNGTPYSAKNRWTDGNLVRWNNGSLRAIGGWERRRDSNGTAIPALYNDPSIEAIRNVMVWETNDGNAYALFGSNRSLYLLNPSGSISIVTPTGFATGAKDEAVNTGYGGDFYGLNAYGTPRVFNELAQPVFTWETDTWGEEALVSERGAGSQLYKKSRADTAFTAVGGSSPTGFNGFVVTDHRFVMTFGATNDPRIVRWSDREDYNTWTASITNQAGSKRLEGKGKLLSGWNILGGVFILSESDAYMGRYINPPYVYGFERVGIDCGPISVLSVAMKTQIAVWPGKSKFFIFDGAVRPLHCEVMDYFLEDKSDNANSKINAMHVPDHHEFWWLYQSENSTEIDSYIVYNYMEDHWITGRLSRTAGASAKPFAPNMMVSQDGIIYSHELPNVAPEDATPYAETGPLELGNGKSLMMVQRVFPDEEFLGGVDMTLLGRQFPTSSEMSFGPYAMANPTPTRARGRQVRMRLEQTTYGWEIGNGMRFEVADAPASSER